MRLEAKKYLYDISEAVELVAIRNILIHGYTQVDDRIVWDIVNSKLPALRRQVAELLKQE